MARPRAGEGGGKGEPPVCVCGGGEAAGAGAGVPSGGAGVLPRSCSFVYLFLWELHRFERFVSVSGESVE